MSEVKLSVGGREYTLACAAGEEEHVAMLGRQVDEKVRQLSDTVSAQETHRLLFGALFLADELHDAKQAEPSPKADEGDSAELVDIRARLEQFREEAAETQAGRDDMAAQLAASTKERDRLSAKVKESLAQIERKDALLNAADTDLKNARQQLENSRTGEQDSTASGASSDAPDLAPALERFAELLEECADKLEAKPASS